MAQGDTGAAPPGNAPKSRRETLWTLRLEAFLRKIRTETLEIARGIFSPDRPTRRMSLVFLICLAGSVAVLVVGARRYQVFRQAREARLSGAEETSKHLGEFFRKQAEDARQRASMLALGTFVIEFKPIPDRKLPPGVMNMAQIDLVLECDSKETRDLLEAQMPKLRNQITSVLVALDRDEVMTKDGKKRLKKSLIDRINLWLPQGKANDVFITRFLIN